MSRTTRRRLRFVILGAGMSGILAAIRLRQAGHDDITLYEKTDRLGGTWRENTYPGIACDVPAHLYTYSFEPNAGWSRMLAPGSEILQYFERTADRYGIRPLIRFGEEVTACVFDEGRWQLQTARGTRDEADVVIAATGVLHHPRMPELPGIERFGGAYFHSARWDHGVPLDGRRVGVIGTGSTAIQITSALSRRASKYSLFQRTAQWIFPMENPAYSTEEKQVFAREPERLGALREELNRMMIDVIADAVIDAESAGVKNLADACLQNLEQGVRDPLLREKLRPTYRAGCKRLILSPDFYEAIQQPMAELVTESIEGVEPAGVRTRDGCLHQLDVLIAATGFVADRFVRPTVVRGRNGVDLDEVWAAKPAAYLSVAIPDFPNLFLLNGPNGPVGNFSLIQVAEFQLDYILQLVEHLRDGSLREIRVRPEVATAYEERRVEAARKTIWSTGCNSWYLDAQGVPASWPWTFSKFAQTMARPEMTAFEDVA
ncbi:flavin-containing monooxygenase [Panacagrimonas sp.]|uniref:flavin-containing monooxygenase n=1 Tax=Panacagrimonas sp. TaxID=2480088 RepID=UPI003B51AF58